MSLLARVIRSGIVEAEHHGAVAVCSPGGALQASVGEVDRRFYSRSAVKPFQATISLEAGAVLSDEEVAVASASHGGFSAHTALVRQILSKVGLDESALQTPPDFPLSPTARDVAVRRGERVPARVFHNCSGKHAAWLAACLAAGRPTETYLDPAHPLQLRVGALLAEMTGEVPGVPGVDGCGAPVFEVSTRGLATAFARLGTDSRFQRVWNAMHRYPALTSENGRIDQRITTWLDAVAKVGAEGCIGVSIRNRIGLAAKAWDGDRRGAEAGIIGGLRTLGLAVGSGEHLGDEQVLGGGRPVGTVQSMVDFA